MLREQRAGFRVIWEYETLLIERATPFEPVVEEVGLRPCRLQAQSGPGMLLLIKTPLRPVDENEARDLVKKHYPGAAYLENKDGRWLAKRIEAAAPSLPGRPPPFVSTKVLGEGETLLELLSNLRILVPPQP